MGRLPILGIPSGVRRLFRLPFRTMKQVGRDVDDEVRFHLEMRAEELIAAGTAPDAARAEALRRFGDAEDLKAFCRTLERPGVMRSRVREWFSDLGQDLRFAARQFRRAPGFTFVAVLTLALGIGANTTIYSVVRPLLLSALPYPGGDRIVALQRTLYQGRISVTPGSDLVDAWRARSRSLQAIATYREGQWTLADRGDAELVSGDYIGPELLTFLGARPLLGRPFLPDDTHMGAAPVVLLSEGLWRRRFGARRDIVGHPVTLDGSEHTVVGVMPRDFGRWILGDLGQRQLFVPVARGPGVAWVNAVGLLRPGVTMEQATRELSAIAVAEAGPAAGEAPGAAVRPIRAYQIQSYGPTLELLFVAVGLVLLIACVNVANLLLMRSWSRQREFGIRTAIGAGRGRMARQLLAESAALSLAGGALGTVVSWRAIPVVVALRPPLMGFLDEARIDPAALAFTLCLSVLTGVVFGFAPALFATRGAVCDRLKDTPTGSGGHAAGGRFRGALIVAEVALGGSLLIGAGLMVRSLVARMRADDALFPKGLMSVALELPVAGYPTAAARQEAFERIVARVRRLRGVEAAALAMGFPWDRGIIMADLEIEGHPAPADQKPVMLGYDRVEPDYFQAVGVPLLAGGVFSGDTNEHAVVVSEAFSRRYFPSGGAIGSRLRFGKPGAWETVVGVVGDLAPSGPSPSAVPQVVYQPMSGMRLPAGGAFAPATLVARGANAAALAPFITRFVLAMDSTIRIRGVYTAAAALAEARAQPRFVATLLSAFAAFALVLAGVGLYGVVAYTVRQRTREVGVRVALGATAPEVIMLILRRALGLALLGIAFGLAGAAAATRLLRSQLYGIGPGDPATFAAVGGVLCFVALLASYLPARAALRIDPVEALRSDG